MFVRFVASDTVSAWRATASASAAAASPSTALTSSLSDWRCAPRSSAVAVATAPRSASRLFRSYCCCVSATFARATSALALEAAAFARAAATRAAAAATALFWSAGSSSNRTSPALTTAPSRTFTFAMRPVTFAPTFATTWGTTYPVADRSMVACAGDTRPISVTATSVLKTRALANGSAQRPARRDRDESLLLRR